MTVKANKRKKLESKGWKIGNAEAFLGLAPEEANYLKLKLVLGQNLRKLREKQKLTQVLLASLVETSQSRIAKMEAGDPSVSLDLLVKTLFALGASMKAIAAIISTSERKAA